MEKDTAQYLHASDIDFDYDHSHDDEDSDDDDDDDDDVSSNISIVSDSNHLDDSSVSESIPSDAMMNTNYRNNKNDYNNEENSVRSNAGNNGNGILGGEVTVIEKFNNLMGSNQESEDEDDFLIGVNENDDDEIDDSDGDSSYDSFSDNEEQVEIDMGDDMLSGDHKRRRGSSVQSENELLGPPIVVPLKTGPDDHIDDLAIGNIDSNDDYVSIGKTRRPADTANNDNNRRTRREGSFRRKPPQRTKSGDGIVNNNDTDIIGESIIRATNSRNGKNSVIDTKGKEPNIQKRQPRRRRPPQRTKSGDFVAVPLQRRLPQRTKSGEGLAIRNHPINASIKNNQNDCNIDDDDDDDEESLATPEEYVVTLPPSSDDDCDSSQNYAEICREHKSDTALPKRERRNDDKKREMALERNSARRQKSSDMLGAMQQATMRGAPPGRSQSSMAAFRPRKPPLRTKSGDGLAVTGPCVNATADDKHIVVSPRRPPRRRPPHRTKSNDGMIINNNISTSINSTSVSASLSSARRR